MAVNFHIICICILPQLHFEILLLIYEYFKGTVSVRKVFKLRLWGGRLVTKDVSDPNFIVLRCPFNLQRIFKDGAYRSKTEFMLG